MSTKASVLSLIGLIVIALFAWLLFSPNPPDTKEDRLITYLDHNNVQYGSTTDIIELADTICKMQAKGIDTESFLRVAFNQKDAMIINYGITNSNYCGDIK